MAANFPGSYYESHSQYEFTKLKKKKKLNICWVKPLIFLDLFAYPTKPSLTY